MGVYCEFTKIILQSKTELAFENTNVILKNLYQCLK